MSMSLLWFPRRIVAGAGTITGGDRSTVTHTSGSFAASSSTGTRRRFAVGGGDHTLPGVIEGGDNAAATSGGDRRTDDG